MVDFLDANIAVGTSLRCSVMALLYSHALLRRRKPRHPPGADNVRLSGCHTRKDREDIRSEMNQVEAVVGQKLLTMSPLADLVSKDCRQDPFEGADARCDWS